MRELPILFSTPMVQAIQRGEKSMTRRVLKPQSPEGFTFQGVCNREATFQRQKSEFVYEYEFVKLPYAVGDRLWVKETHAFVNIYGAEIDAKEFHCKTDRTILYRADGPPWQYCTGNEIPDFSDGPMGKMVPEFRETLLEPTWKPSLFMPRWAARIWLEVTAVRVERLQEILLTDIIAEGISEDADIEVELSSGAWVNGPRGAFCALWQSINGKKHPWGSNPWVGVYEFRRIENA